MPIIPSRRKNVVEPPKGFSKATKELLARRKVCKACEGSCKNSRGGECYPCAGTGREGAANEPGR